MGEMLLICQEINRTFASSKEELCHSNAIEFTDYAIYMIMINLPEEFCSDGEFVSNERLSYLLYEMC